MAKRSSGKGNQSSTSASCLPGGDSHAQSLTVKNDGDKHMLCFMNWSWALIYVHRWWERPVLPAQTSAFHFGHFGWLTFLLFRDHLALPLLQTLHLTCLKFGEILFLHVNPTELSTKGIMGNVLLLLGLWWGRNGELVRLRNLHPIKDFNAT